MIFGTMLSFALRNLEKRWSIGLLWMSQGVSARMVTQMAGSHQAAVLIGRNLIAQVVILPLSRTWLLTTNFLHMLLPSNSTGPSTRCIVTQIHSNNHLNKNLQNEKLFNPGSCPVHKLIFELWMCSCVQASQEGLIGITLDSNWFVPVSNDKSDHEAAQRALDFMFGW